MKLLSNLVFIKRVNAFVSEGKGIVKVVGQPRCPVSIMLTSSSSTGFQNIKITTRLKLEQLWHLRKGGSSKCGCFI